MSPGSGMDAATVQAAYSRWARTYDWTFGIWFSAARRRAIERLDQPDNGRAIEVGVGTGLSLPLFPEDCRVVGVDFSRAMLERATLRRRRGERGRWTLVEGDGRRLPFDDATFDAGLAPFVVSAAPRPAALLRDLWRVCKPGARIVILNHFSPANPIVAGIERALSALTSRLCGFQADFPLEPLFERADIAIDRIERATMIGGWYIVTCTRRE